MTATAEPLVKLGEFGGGVQVIVAPGQLSVIGGTW
jgi:hypothetical protein